MTGSLRWTPLLTTVAMFAPTIEVFCMAAQPRVHDGSEWQRFPKMPSWKRRADHHVPVILMPIMAATISSPLPHAQRRPTEPPERRCMSFQPHDFRLHRRRQGLDKFAERQ
jgi:hypothetical protein